MAMEGGHLKQSGQLVKQQELWMGTSLSGTKNT